LKRLLTILALIGIITAVSAQKQANFWYFGSYAGLNFSLGLPVAVTNGALDTWEGCSSISSENGQLLFYTDGRYVYNKNHQEMPNGQGLMGDESSTQSGIIVPRPGSSSDYYIFTVDKEALSAGLRYSKVDMNLDGGLGDVVTSEKNIALVAPTCEKVTAVGHFNGGFFWVITHLWNSDAFHAYEVTDAGVNTTPVVSNAGEVIGSDYQFSKGYMKLSPDGAWLALANNTKFTIGIFSFNNANGQISNALVDTRFSNPGGGDPGGPYGVGFSPDSKLLYIAEWKNGKKIWQYDLSAGTHEDILNSRVLVASVGGGANNFGALQLGPDNRLYIARWQSPHLSHLTYPAVYGTGCDFVDVGVNLAGKSSGYGLPPFIQSFFNLNTDILYDLPVCDGDSVQFYTSTGIPPDSVRWTFGDPASGPYNISNQVNPQHKFSAAQFYVVKLKLYVGIQSDSVVRLVIVNPLPQAIAGDDQSIPYGTTTTLEGSVDPPGNYDYVWEPAELLDDPTSPTPTTVQLVNTTVFSLHVTGTTGGCEDDDEVTINITGGPLGINPYSSPTEVCLDDQAQLFPLASGGSGNYQYNWTSDPPGFSSTLAEPFVIPQQTTTYYVSVSDGFNVESGEATVEVIPAPIPEAGEDQAIPHGTTTALSGSGTVGSGYYAYHWEPADKLVNPNVANPTTVKLYESTFFTLSIIDNATGCEGLETDVMNVAVTGGPLSVAAFTQDSLICYGGSTQLDAQGSGGDYPNYIYHWTSLPPGFYSNLTNPEVDPTGTTEYVVEVDDGFNTNRDTVKVRVSDPMDVNLGGDRYECPYDSVSLGIATPKPGYSYYWSTGDTSRMIKVGSTGIGYDSKDYTIDVWDQDGCEGSDEVKVVFDFANCFGVEEFEHQLEVEMYPNPSKGDFTLKFEGDKGVVDIRIYNTQGMEIEHAIENISSPGEFVTSFALPKASPGVYFIKVVHNEKAFVGNLLIE